MLMVRKHATERPGFGALKQARRSSADAKASLNSRLLGVSISVRHRASHG